jgi:uncharacterized protein YcgI (DUF1989 family)
MSSVTAEVIVPAREGRAVLVRAGQRLRVTTPTGGQAVDLFAFNEGDMGEWLSPMHTWAVTGCLRPREGDTFLTQLRNPILEFEEDGAGGVHDMLLAACDERRYRHLGMEPRPGCADNMRTALAQLGYSPGGVPQPVNLFTNIGVGPNLEILGAPSTVQPGAYVVLRALVDTVCAASCCPHDGKTPWPINREPSDIELRVLGT